MIAQVTEIATHRCGSKGKKSESPAVSVHARRRLRSGPYPLLTAAERGYIRACEIQRAQLKLHTIDWYMTRHTIPSRKQLAKLYGVSYATVRLAALDAHYYKRRCPRETQ